VSTGLRVLLALAGAALVLIILLGPRWRGAFYRTWLRPRLVAFGVLLVLFGIGLYVYRVVQAVGAR
jgi:predicted Kef-type K+ transport protein